MRFFLFIVFWFAWSAMAQTDTVRVLKEVTKTARIKPMPIVPKYRIDSLDKLPANTLALALSATSSVYVRNYGQPGIAGIAFRGTSSAQTQVLWNGIPVNSLTLGQSDLSVQPLDLVDNIDISSGADALEKTNGGLGGVVALNTELPTSAGLSVVSSFASFGNQRLGMKLHSVEKNMQSSFRFFAHRGKNDFLIRDRTLLPVEEVHQKNGEVQQIGLSGDVRLMHKNASTTISFYGLMSDRNMPPLLESINQREQMANNQMRVMASWQVRSKFSPTVAFTQLYDDFIYRQEATGWHSEVASQAQHLKFNAFHDFLRSEMHTELWLIHEQVVSSGIADRESRFRPSWSVSFKRSADSIWKLDVTTRQEWFQNRVMPSARLFTAFRPFRKMPFRFITTLSRNYRIPTFNDLYWNPGGNSDLKAETAHSADVGLELFPEKQTAPLYVKSVVFANQINNWIQWVPGQSGFTDVRNVRQVFIRGVESALDYKLSIGKWRIKAGVRHTLAISQELNPVEEELKGKDLIFSPRNVWNGHAEVGRKNWSLHYIQTYTAMSYLDAYNLGYMPYFAPATLGISKENKAEEGRWSVSFFVHNLYSEEFQVMPNRPMPLRNYELRISFLFG